MKLFALLAWFDEDPAWLERCITQLAELPVDHLIAVDGAYALYPGGRPRSPLINYEAIHRACFQTKIAVTIHTPSTVWEGNECEKRTALFRLADQHSTDGKDWYLVVDTDEFAKQSPPDLRDRLRTSVFDVANATLSEPHPTGRRRDYPMPMLFRSIHGITVEGNHFTYKTPDHRTLWGNVLVEKNLAPRLDIEDLVFDHLTEFRHPDRRKAAREYYDIRDDTSAEDFECNVDGCTRHAKHTLPFKWKRVPDGEGYAANWCAVCPEHRASVCEQGIRQLTDLGEPDAEALYFRKQWAVMPGLIEA